MEFVLPHSLPVQGDRRLLTVLLENLLSNAWKFTGRHTSARIELGSESVSGERVYFVRDDGAGFDMDTDRAKALFTPFQRLHSQKA